MLTKALHWNLLTVKLLAILQILNFLCTFKARLHYEFLLLFKYILFCFRTAKDFASASDKVWSHFAGKHRMIVLINSNEKYLQIKRKHCRRSAKRSTDLLFVT